MSFHKIKMFRWGLFVTVGFILNLFNSSLVKAQETDLDIDQLLSISSQVSGDVQWTKDGDQVMFKSGDGLSLVDVDEKYIQQIKPITLGKAGHFLSSQHINISPNGELIAYISDKGGNPEVWLHSLESGKGYQLTKLGQSGLNALSWSPDSDWIAFSGNRYGNYDIWKVSVESGQIHQMTDDDLYEVNPSWTPDGERIIYIKLNDEWTNHDIISINSKDASGSIIIEQDKDFFDYGYGRTFGFAQVSPDGKNLLFPSHRNGWINYWVKPLNGGDVRPVYQEQADQSNGSWSPDGSSILFTSNYNGTHKLNIVRGSNMTTIVDPEMGVVSDPVWSPGGNTIAFTLTTPTTPKDLFIIDSKGETTQQLTYSMPAGNYSERLVKPKKIKYQSTDGLTISAYLYEPEEPGSYPGIMWIHGGPTSQYNDTFEQHVQYFVNNGYVVMQPNIRGSSGYGKNFEKANQKCWGHCDMDDVRAGVEYLKKLPNINPDKMGIHGTSYGGIMSMAAIAFAPDLFQASIPASGYGDWVSFYHKPNELRHYKLSNYELGTFEENENIWRKASAIYEIDQVKTPVFLVHGIGKYPPSPQSEQFAKELEAHYKTFEYKAYPNEHYYVRTKENRRQMLLDMHKFLDKFLKDNVIKHPSN
ncbi:MAG: S9 family peptidase [Gracilimonas sp.]|uniref:prolyl oligopeptidase family serine peptidase n=1 Tax=Gracilimonas sp. TaxID=1974203 RepID=UPI0037528600|nr:S9 family peptidase [Gracilimonas sp.]